MNTAQSKVAWILLSLLPFLLITCGGTLPAQAGQQSSRGEPAQVTINVPGKTWQIQLSIPNYMVLEPGENELLRAISEAGHFLTLTEFPDFTGNSAQACVAKVRWELELVADRGTLNTSIYPGYVLIPFFRTSILRIRFWSAFHVHDNRCFSLTISKQPYQPSDEGEVLAVIGSVKIVE